MARPRFGNISFEPLGVSSPSPAQSGLSCGMSLATARRRVVAAVDFDLAAFPVHVARPRPIAERMIGTRLVATFRRCVEDAVDSKHLLSAAAVRRVGVEDLASFVLVKNAAARQVLDIGGPFRCVMIGLRSATELVYSASGDPALATTLKKCAP